MTDRILVIDDEEAIRFTFSEFLRDAGYNVSTAFDFKSARKKLEETEFDAVFLDIMLGLDCGIDVLKIIKTMNPNCPVMMVTGGPDIKTAAEAVRYGAFDYLLKPVGEKDLLLHAKRAVDVKRIRDMGDRYQKRLAAIFDGVGDGILVFDSDFNLIDINAAGTKLLNCNYDVVGMSLAEIIESTANPILWALKESIEERVDGELYRLELDKANGEKVCIGASLSPLTTATGKDNDFIVTLRNESLPVRDIKIE